MIFLWNICHHRLGKRRAEPLQGCCSIRLICLPWAVCGKEPATGNWWEDKAGDQQEDSNLAFLAELCNQE